MKLKEIKTYDYKELIPFYSFRPIRVMIYTPIKYNYSSYITRSTFKLLKKDKTLVDNDDEYNYYMIQYMKMYSYYFEEIIIYKIGISKQNRLLNYLIDPKVILYVAYSFDELLEIELKL